MTTPFLPSRWLVTPADTTSDPDVFPLLPGQMLISGKRPVWSTAVSTAQSGRERRRRNWSYPLWKFKLSYEVVRQRPDLQELSQLLVFFNTHAGSHRGFFYRDPTDCTVTDGPIGTGDGTATTFQMQRSVVSGTMTFTEPVRGLLGAPVVTVGGTPTTAFTINPYGGITFDTPPANLAEILWSGTFMHLVRFDTDELEFEQMTEFLWSQRGLDLVSLKR